MGTNTMIPVLVPLTYRYKKYPYPLFVDNHLQYLFPNCYRFYLQIPANMDFFHILTCKSH